MKYAFAIVGVLLLLSSAMSCVSAKSSIHEGLGILVAIAGLICLIAAVVIGELAEIRRRLPAPPAKSQE